MRRTYLSRLLLSLFLICSGFLEPVYSKSKPSRKDGEKVSKSPTFAVSAGFGLFSLHSAVAYRFNSFQWIRAIYEGTAGNYEAYGTELRTFFGKTFYTDLGLLIAEENPNSNMFFMFRSEARSINSDLGCPPFSKEISCYVPITGNRRSVNGTIAIGNEWRWESGFAIAVDWIGLSVAAINISQPTAGGSSSTDKEDILAAQKALEEKVGPGSIYLLGFNLGYMF